MPPKFREIVSTSTFRQSLVTFSGVVLNGALGAVFYIISARFLGPAAFGLMSVAIAALTLITDIGDLGTDTGLVRFVGKHIKEKPQKAFRFLKLGLEVKIIVGLTVLLLGWLLAPFVANTLFVKSELTNPLIIAFVGVLFLLLFSFITHTLQALQKFWAWSGIQVGTNFLRVVIVLLLLYLGKLTLDSNLVTYISMPLVGFIFGIIFLLPKKFLKIKKETSVAKEFFHYNKWVATFTFVAAFSSRLDTFISARLLATTDVGLYSAASRLVQIVPQIVAALGTVIAPKMAAMGDLKDFVSYLKKTQIMVVGLALLGILAIPLVVFLIPYLYGADYLASIPLFIVLLFAMLVFLIAVPVHNAVFYYFSYPKLFFWLSLLHLAIIGGLGWNLISTFGAMGAAVTVLIGSVGNFIIPLIWVISKIKQSRKTN
jgi:O-antigen/teichoic acid export membrane protein